MRFLPVAAIVLMALSLVACGGDGDSKDVSGSADGTPQPTTALETPTPTTVSACDRSFTDKFMADLDAIILDSDQVTGELLPPAGVSGPMHLLDQGQRMSNLRLKAELLNARGCPDLEELRGYATTLIGGWAAFYLTLGAGEQPGSTDYLKAEQKYKAKHTELEQR